MGDLSVRRQLEAWVQGESIHNEKLDECCPDFSCCNKNVKTPQEVKDLFFHAYHNDKKDLMNRLLMEFLANVLSGENVYIAGLEASRQELD